MKKMTDIRLKHINWISRQASLCEVNGVILVINGKRMVKTYHFDKITPGEADDLEEWKKENIKNIPAKLLVVIDNLLTYIRSVEKNGIENVNGLECLKQPPSNLKY